MFLTGIPERDIIGNRSLATTQLVLLFESHAISAISPHEPKLRRRICERYRAKGVRRPKKLDSRGVDHVRPDPWSPNYLRLADLEIKLQSHLGPSCTLKSTPSAPIRARRSGRVERAHQTLQDRLVKELRPAGARTLADGNALLPPFTADYNARFAKPPGPGTHGCLAYR